MAQEIELPFLVTRLPDLSGIACTHIVQSYPPLGDGSMRLRVSMRGGIVVLRELTKKTPAEGYAKEMGVDDEHNVPLSEREYERLKPLFPRELTKDRFKLPLPGGYVSEIDMYGDALEGLIRVEVEFRNVAEKLAFTPPDWFGRCLKGEPWAKNSALAGKTFAEIKGFLEEPPAH
ncbi:MAG: hypothetical protein RLZZ324_1127 [Candidatus Parcubacteria bacterium]|jgi:CYTH domain-containing protein